MADSVDQISVSYPIPSYRFQVRIGDDMIPFSNVSGMNLSVETAQYLDGIGGIYNAPAKRQTQVTLTLTKGLFKGQSVIYDWFNSISMNKVEKKDVSISLTDESGTELLMTWNVYNVFPTEISAPTLDASSNEIAIETLTLMGDRITAQYH